MTSNKNYSFSSYIKDLYIEVPNYRYHHHPNTGKGNTTHPFIGREKLQKRFLDILLKGSRNGAYLVTGYRGMGKTSLVNKVVEEYSNEEEKSNPSIKVVNLKISLAQSKLDETDVLKHILKLLYEEIRKDREASNFYFLEYYSYFLSIIVLFSTILLFILTSINQDLPGVLSKEGLGILAVIITLSTFFLIFIHNTCKILLELIIKHIISLNNQSTEWKKKHKELVTDTIKELLKITFIAYIPIHILIFGHSSTQIVILTIAYIIISDYFSIISERITGFIYERVHSLHKLTKLYNLNKQISILYDRSSATITKSSGNTSFLKDVINTLTGSQVHTFPIASNKEIEYELIDILAKYDFKKFIFIFDELDKVEMDTDSPLSDSNPGYNQERTFLNDLRERKQVIIKVFSSMKHLLTEAQARFIFIAGREMFDASLADISDRQSALGSIFHSVFYVDSFLKIIQNTSPDSTFRNLNHIEEYLNTLLFNQSGNNTSSNSFYKNFWELLNTNIKNDEEKNDEAIKLMYCMQNYVTYLTYRSNGSPKKLIRLFEENILNESSINLSEVEKKSIPNNKYISSSTKSIIYSNQPITDPNSKRVFINFSFKQQYKFGFNAYLFLPFLFTKKSYLNNLNDNINVSTPYLMDHIIKFHPFAFSNHNLELLPELLSSNKSPELRKFIQDLIDYLEKNHIRIIDSGLFKYKFLDRTHHEIAYISRVSDEESAAFNFSSDENHSIKTHLIYKVNYLRKAFKNFKKHRNSSIESLTFLNDLLGDSYLFDEAYKDSIVSLVDSIHDIPPPSENMSIESFLLWMRIKLKISMVFDKMKYHEMAVGNLGVAMHHSLIYMSSITQNQKSYSYNSPLYNELLQVTQQTILGSIYVQEKFGESITYSKLETYIKKYKQIAQQAPSNQYTKRDTTIANFFANLGILLYYKNKTLPYRTTLEVKSIMIEFNKLPAKKLDPSNDDHKFICDQLLSVITKTPVFALNYSDNKELNFSQFIVPSFCELYTCFDYESRDFRFSLITYICYKKALGSYLAINSDKSIKLSNLIIETLKLVKEYRNVHDTRKLLLLADSISRIGDLLYTLFNNEKHKNKYVLNNVVDSYNALKVNSTKLEYENILDDAFFKNLENIINLDNEDLTYIDYPISLFYLSAKLYIKASKNALASFQLKKILLTIHRSGALEGLDKTYYKKLETFLQETILKKILKLCSSSSIVSDRLQISSMKHYMNLNNATLKTDEKRSHYSQLATSADTKEALVLMADIKIKYYKTDTDKNKNFNDEITTIAEFNLLKQTNSISMQSLRIMELILQVKLNTYLLHNTLNKNLMIKNTVSDKSIFLVPYKLQPDNISWQNDLYPYTISGYKNANINQSELDTYIKSMSVTEDTRHFTNYTQLIANSIFCLYQAILTSNIYDINYMQGNAYLGTCHLKLGNWIKHLNLCRLIKEKSGDNNANSDIIEAIDKMEKDIKMLVGETSLRNINNSLSQYQTALEYFENSIQLHSEGPAYKHHLNNMIYLEDDYGDTYNHFGAALERQLINSGKIRATIDFLKKQLSPSALFNYSSFVPNESNNS